MSVGLLLSVQAWPLLPGGGQMGPERQRKVEHISIVENPFKLSETKLATGT